MRTPDLSVSRDLFVYGTLQSKEVLTTLLNTELDGVPAVALSIEVLKVKERVYPFARKAEGKETHGVVVQPEKAEHWEVLDCFEDPRYSLSLIETRMGKAWCYLDSNNAFEPDGLWSYEDFRHHHLDDYVALVQRVRMRFLANESRLR